MADTVVLPGTGAVVATDEVTDGTLGTVQVQYVKLMGGALNATTKGDVDANGRLATLARISGAGTGTTSRPSASNT